MFLYIKGFGCQEVLGKQAYDSFKQAFKRLDIGEEVKRKHFWKARSSFLVKSRYSFHSNAIYMQRVYNCFKSM